LIVTEPTAAGIHDMVRVLETTSHFRIPALVVINKADIFPEGCAQIESYCLDHSIEVVGKIPFDKTVTLAMLNGKPVTAFCLKSPSSREMEKVWQNVMRALDIQKNTNDIQEIA
jgi:MinD superfamily P-loop ATPase